MVDGAADASDRRPAEAASGTAAAPAEPADHEQQDTPLWTQLGMEEDAYHAYVAAGWEFRWETGWVQRGAEPQAAAQPEGELQAEDT